MLGVVHGEDDVVDGEWGEGFGELFEHGCAVSFLGDLAEDEGSLARGPAKNVNMRGGGGGGGITMRGRGIGRFTLVPVSFL